MRRAWQSAPPRRARGASASVRTASSAGLLQSGARRRPPGRRPSRPDRPTNWRNRSALQRAVPDSRTSTLTATRRGGDPMDAIPGRDGTCRGTSPTTNSRDWSCARATYRIASCMKATNAGCSGRLFPRLPRSDASTSTRPRPRPCSARATCPSLQRASTLAGSFCVIRLTVRNVARWRPAANVPNGLKTGWRMSDGTRFTPDARRVAASIASPSPRISRTTAGSTVPSDATNIPPPSRT